jgi:gamma-glutamylcyclotransferase (GGCT)/AIG2-like uncharacterized protein YtfP
VVVRAISHTDNYITMKTPIFIYGTLMSPRVVSTLLGRPILSEFPPATLSGHSRHPVRDQVFPGTIPNVNGEVQGRLLENMSPLDINFLDWFEGNEYDRKMAKVVCTESGTSMDAQVYIWRRELIGELKLDEGWNHEAFCKENLEWYLENTVRPCRQEMERLGITKE